MQKVLGLLVALLFTTTAHAAMLEIPGPNAHLSGIGVISGWKCEADGPLTVRINAGSPIPLLYGSERKDTHGVCGDTRNGFVAIWNWGNLGDGVHTAVAYDNGVEFARNAFSVMTTGEPFLRDAEGECSILNFPARGEVGYFVWSQATQHLELKDVTPDYPHLRCGEHPETCLQGDYRDRKDTTMLYRWYCVGSGGGIRCQAPKPPSAPEEEEEEEPSLEERCRTDAGAIDMCCVCCDPEGQNQSICTQNPQIADQCRSRPEGCGPPEPVDGECGSAPNTCASGTYYDSPDSDTLYRWECRGRNGGSTAYCDELKNPSPLAKFEGRWSLSSVITAHCSRVEGQGELRVHRGRLSGWFQQNETVRTGEGTYRQNFRFQLGGMVSETGTVDGRFEWSDGVTVDGWFTGTLSNRTGSGTWHDTAGCVGTWRARKQD